MKKEFFRSELNAIQIIKLGIMIVIGGFGLWAILKVISLLEAILDKL